jgi:hypothetical protein
MDSGILLSELPKLVTSYVQMLKRFLVITPMSILLRWIILIPGNHVVATYDMNLAGILTEEV